MSVINKAIALSKKIAESFLNNDSNFDLDCSDILSTSDKSYIQKHITNKALLKERRKISKQINSNADWRIISKRINAPKRKSFFMKYNFAAISAVFLVCGYLITINLYNSETKPKKPVSDQNLIKIGTDKAILTLEDGTNIALEKGNSFARKNIKSNGKKLIYNEKKENSTPEKPVYNILTIPRGGEFYIQLSDNSKVWLNSESQLKYPIHFIKGQDRVVELVYGEAYFDISPSIHHHGSKFKVMNKHQEIEVLGTEFNIKAYKEDQKVYTTLVEGKVSVSTPNNTQTLKPSQQIKLNTNSGIANIETVNVYNETSWKEGVFSFRRKPLGEIMKVLSRWYDMDVKFNDPELKKAGFNGFLGKNQEIVEILEAIKNFEVIKDYEIKDKTLILK